MSQVRTERFLFFLLLLAYLIVAALFAARTPAWQAPDEPAHYNYVAQVAANGCCPLLEAGDWNSAYLETLKAAHFAPDTLSDLASVQYEDHQPPLYYLLAALVFRLTNGSLLALRLFSVLPGAGVVAVAYATGKTLLPHRPQIALGAAAFVAFLPQHVAMLAAAENDSLAEFIVALALWATVVYLKAGRVKAWQLGVLVGLGLLTKASTIFLAGLVPLAILLRWWIVRRNGRAHSRAPLRDLVAFALPAVILGGIWWVRNVNVYGFPDVFGLGRHNLVVADQLRSADLIAQVGISEYLRRGLETTFNSFWGQFGWMALPLPNWMYGVFLGGLIAASFGYGMRRIRGARRDAERPVSAVKSGYDDRQRAAWLILGLAAALAVAQYLYYNVEFVQFQGRYMYPGLIPLGLWIALGLDGWRRILPNWRYTVWFAPAVIALLVPLDLYLIWRVIPGLAP